MITVCGCIFAILSLASPRLGFLFLWIFTNYVERAFDGFIYPFLGLIFLPFTSVVYVLVYNPITGVSLLGWVFVILAFMFDLGSYGGSAYSNRDYVKARS